MSRPINQPINQVRLTNVAVVRYSKGGKRFEVACYRNKVMDYRAGLETDLSEVLQTDRIFTNVSKGQFANSKDLMKAFGTRDEEEIAKLILDHGNSLQVSDLERNQQLHNNLSQITTWVASNCVHPATGRPYTASQIKHILQKNYTVQTHKAIKRQYLDAVKYLKTVIPIERAKMELSVQYPQEAACTVHAALDRMPHKLVKENTTADGKRIFVLQVDPSYYRELDELTKAVKGRLEILQQVVIQSAGDQGGNVLDLEKELVLKTQHDTISAEKETEALVESDSEVKQLVSQLDQIRIKSTADRDEVSDNDDDDHDELIVQQQRPSRKAQRKAQKKSKKAQRREQEETADRNERIEREKAKQEERFVKTQENPVIQANAANAASDGSKACNTCGGAFPNAAAYRAHFRSDWHRFNQKLKLKGIPAVSEAEFLICDAETFFGRDDD